MTSANPHPSPLSSEQLSALFDGVAEETELDRLCQQWADEETRAQWHTWSLIGDVLRSEDLAQTPNHDAHFLATLRERLAQEPVVLAPASLPRTPRETGIAAPSGGRGRARAGLWIGSAAVAASVAVVVGTWLQQPNGLQQAQSPTLAQITPPEAIKQPPLTMVRDPELDRYLAAHRQYVQGPALAAPGGVRQVAVNPGR